MTYKNTGVLATITPAAAKSTASTGEKLRELIGRSYRREKATSSQYKQDIKDIWDARRKEGSVMVGVARETHIAFD